MTLITIAGNLTGDPELKFTPSGTAVANFTVAVNERIFDKTANEYKTASTSFYRCDVWRGLAESVAGELRKGQRVIVYGEIKIREYEKQDGSKAASTEISVKEIGAALKWAESKQSDTTPAAPSASAWGATGGGPF